MVGVDSELKSSYDTYVPGHEFLPIYQGLLNDNPNLKVTQLIRIRITQLISSGEVGLFIL